MTLSKAYKEGLGSFSKNGGKLQNPYDRGTTQNLEFEKGWAQALRATPQEEILRLEKLHESERRGELELNEEKKQKRASEYRRRKG
jgi:hypothetical protein